MAVAAEESGAGSDSEVDAGIVSLQRPVEREVAAGAVNGGVKEGGGGEGGTSSAKASRKQASQKAAMEIDRAGLASGSCEQRQSFHHGPATAAPAVTLPPPGPWPLGAGPPGPWPPRDAEHLLVRADQMAALEAELFASGLPVEALMEKAALALTHQLLQEQGERLRQVGAVVLVGPGHNGGDGLVIARELHLAGIPTALWSPFERHKPLTASHLRHALWLGIPRLDAPPPAEQPALWLDALFGAGQRRAPGEPLETLLKRRQQQRPGQLVAVDVPTGLCSDSGALLGNGAACAAVTYTLGLIKQGLVQDPALRYVGRLQRIELGLPSRLLEALPADQPLGLGAGDLATAPAPHLDPAASKYERGRLLVLAGSRRYRGAALLALRGASASGCGSLQAALPDVLTEQLWQVLPHAVMAAALACDAEGCLQLGDLEPRLLERLDAVLLGPGIGLRRQLDGAELASWRRLQQFAGLLVLDADGLNRLAGPVAEALGCSPAQWCRERAGATWLTPHRGEFTRLFPELAAVPVLEAAQQAAAVSGAAVVLKGARSVVAAPGQPCRQLLVAAASAARAGLGDVLAGYVAGQGARTVASDRLGQPGGDSLATSLAAATLAHALAGWRLEQRWPLSGGGAASPLAVAEELAWPLVLDGGQC